MVKDGDNDALSLKESDVTRQAELVVMEYLKSSNCAKTLDAIMTQGDSAVSKQSAIASDLYAEDLEKKKKSGAKSVLDYVVTRLEGEMYAKPLDSTLSSTHSSSSSNSRRRSSADESGDEKSSSVEWTREDVSRLKKAIKQTSDVSDKNARWKQIASLVGNSKNKKHCYLKYKELKEEKSSSRTSSGDERSSRRRSSSSEEKSSHRKGSLSSTASATTNERSCNATFADSAEKPQTKPTSLEDEDKGFEPVLLRAAPMASTKLLRKETKAEELQMEDCDDFDAPVVPSSRGSSSGARHGGSSIASSSSSSSSSMPVSTAGRALSADEIESLRSILFPDDRQNFSSHWEKQGFFYSDARDLGYGLVQNEGGPCGVLAVVQAYVLRFLLDVVCPSDWRNPTQREQEQAVVLAISHILWQAARASKKSQCVVVLNDEKTSSSSGSKRKFASGLLLYTTKSPEQTQTLLVNQAKQFMAPKGNGLVLLVLSALLSKGVDTIKPEMDSVEGALGGGGKLIGGHDYCTQEIVNLLLSGVACSNVFNGKQLLEGTSEDDPKAVVLKGFASRCTVGFLSLFEAYEYILVGSHLKSPQFNIWVVCSESHYSVLFADPKLLTSDAIHDKMSKLDVFYFDGLGSQDEEIRLTVHAFALQEKTKPKADELIPPLNLVLQTKWPLARIDWNGVDPLL